MNVAWPIAAAAAASTLLTVTARAEDAPPEPTPVTPEWTVAEGPPLSAATPITPDPVSTAAPPDSTDYPTVERSTAAAAWQDDPWRFSVTPYVFLPTIEGQLRFNPPPTDDGAPRVTIDAGDILDALEFAFMISADAHYNRFGVITDLLYVDLGAQQARVDQIVRPGGVIDVPLDIDTSVGLKSWLWTGAFGVEFGEPRSLTIEPFLGFRYLRTEADLDWSVQGPIGAFPLVGSLSQDQDAWDGVAGVRGYVALGEESRWNVTYYADVGAGDSELTWQVIGGIGYEFGWGDLRFVWRHIEYEQDDEAFIQNISLTGPAFGATFRF